MSARSRSRERRDKAQRKAFLSLSRNQQEMGFSGITGLASQSPVLPHYAYRRNQKHLQQWIVNNNRQVGIRRRVLSWCGQFLNAIHYLCVSSIFPKLAQLRNTIVRFCNYFDIYSLIVMIVVVLFLFVWVLATVFVPSDYKQQTEPIKNDIVVEEDNSIHDLFLVNDQNPTLDPILQELEQMNKDFESDGTQIFKHSDDSDSDSNLDTEIQYDVWQTMNDINWQLVQHSQQVLLSVNGEIFHAYVTDVQYRAQRVQFTYLHDCWAVFGGCTHFFDINSNQQILITKSKSKSQPVRQPAMQQTNDIQHVIHDDVYQPNLNTNPVFTDDDKNEILLAIKQLNEKNNALNEMVEQNRNSIHNKVVDNSHNMNDLQIKQSLTNYLDSKMDSFAEIINQQQNIIEQISVSHINHEILLNNTLDSQVNDNIDFHGIHNQIDEQIDSKLDAKLDQFGTAFVDQVVNQIQNKYVDQMPSSGSSKDSNKVDFAFKVVKHSGIFVSGFVDRFGHYIVHNWLGHWSQAAILDTNKPGDCTPLSINSDDIGAYIMIELYRNIQPTQISLFHYHSPVLSKTAIDAAPKDFQIFGSDDGQSWHDFGNFTYYYDGDDVQLFSLNLKHEQVDAAQYKYIVFRVLSNGGSDYTCIYRLRVYGHY